MGANSAIEWTDHTFNPWIGCARVSPACEHCYAETRSNRLRDAVWGKNGTRTITSDNYWKQPHRWDRDAAQAGTSARVFCASLADVYEDRPELAAPRARLFDLIEATPHLWWLLLTKRPENIVRLTPREGLPPNVWLGTTVEDQRRADERIPALFHAANILDATLCFLSCEPLLGPLDLDLYLNDGIEWVIAGGESGAGARPSDPDWFRSLCAQCHDWNVPFFFKQWGEHDGRQVRVGKKAAGATLDGRRWLELPPL